MKKRAAYGTWDSSLSGDCIAQASIKVSEPQYNQGYIYWLEARPSEKGRQTIVRRDCTGKEEDMLKAPWNARSKVHEYGGGCYCLGGGYLFFCHADDQRIYQLDLQSREIVPITQQSNRRYADLRFEPRHQRLLVVCEDHSGGTHEPQNYLLALELGGNSCAERIIDRSHDFVATPRTSPCGQWLTYISWDHPNMPWDASQLWLCRFDKQGNISEPRCLAGTNQADGARESLFLPQWSPAGDLYWVSDRSNWWNLYSLNSAALSHFWETSGPAAEPTAVYPHEAEYATPQWVFNMSTYGFLGEQEILATYTRDGVWQLLHLRREHDQWQSCEIDTGLTSIANISCTDGQATFVGAGPNSPLAVYEYAGAAITPLHTPAEAACSSEATSTARSIRFPTANGEVAHAFFYPPTSAEFEADETALPPVIVIGHGGPTGATDSSFNYKIQYWTQRGFAVLDVNYRGSTGFGRPYRQALRGQWGVVDVQDLSAAAEYVTAQGWVHPQQRVIRGSSAGGYSVLAALTDTNTFNAGVTLYGIGDLETLATDTHKFEARYLDGLIGPYPEKQDLYRQRSPIHKVDRIRCPVMVFQGQEDKVVPPNQAEQIVGAVKRQGLPVAYVLYPDEGHGFRQSSNIAHQLQAELYFYQQVFGLGATTDPAPVEIHNWELR